MRRRTRRTTLTLDVDALEMAERVAKVYGISVSELASRAIRNEALRLGAPPRPRGSELEAIYDEAELTAMDHEEDGGKGAAR